MTYPASVLTTCSVAKPWPRRTFAGMFHVSDVDVHDVGAQPEVFVSSGPDAVETKS